MEIDLNAEFLDASPAALETPIITPAEFLAKIKSKELKLIDQNLLMDDISTDRQCLIRSLKRGMSTNANGLIKTILILGDVFTNEVSVSIEELIHFQREKDIGRNFGPLQDKGLGLIMEFTINKPWSSGEQTGSVPVFTADGGKTWSGIVGDTLRIERSIKEFIYVLHDLSSLKDRCDSIRQNRKWLLYEPEDGVMRTDGKIYRPIGHSVESLEQICSRIEKGQRWDGQIACEESSPQPRQTSSFGFGGAPVFGSGGGSVSFSSESIRWNSSDRDSEVKRGGFSFGGNSSTRRGGFSFSGDSDVKRGGFSFGRVPDFFSRDSDVKGGGFSFGDAHLKRKRPEGGEEPRAKWPRTE